MLFGIENMGKIHKSKINTNFQIQLWKKKLNKQMIAKQACIQLICQIISPMNTYSDLSQEILILVYADYITECKPFISQIKSPEKFQINRTRRFGSAIPHKSYTLINPGSLYCSTLAVHPWQSFIPLHLYAPLQSNKAC